MPGQLEHFISTPETLKNLRNVFAGLYSLDESEYVSSADFTSVKNNAILYTNKYVMKPQREGGGNNIYNTGTFIYIACIAYA